MAKGITVSKKYGLNPSVDHCVICGKELGVALFGTAYKDKDGKTAEAPKDVCTGHICDNCQKIIDEGGVFLVEVKDGTDHNNPYRTGRLVAIKKEAAERMFKDYNPTMNYVEHTLFEQLFGEALSNEQELQEKSSD